MTQRLGNRTIDRKKPHQITKYGLETHIQQRALVSAHVVLGSHGSRRPRQISTSMLFVRSMVNHSGAPGSG